MFVRLIGLLFLNLFTFASSFQIGSLLSTCVDACQRGCIEIRKVQAKRETTPNKSMQVEWKDQLDPRSALTEADELAHKMIVGSLLATWGSDLNIVSEEEGDEYVDESIPSMIYETLKKDMFDDDIGETPDIDPSDITIFIDPLDGTREFVEGRLENCQVLVGIAVRGEAVAGAIGIPFPNATLDSEPTLVYGLSEVGSGVIGATLTRGPYPLNKHIDGVKYPRPHHATGDSMSDVMNACRKGATKRLGGSTVTYGGAGNKILAAALGEVVCSIQHKVGGPWDLCAPEAVLKAMGGKMTDLFGKEIEIYKADAPSRCNERGYIASAPGADEDGIFHQALANHFLAHPTVQKYRDDVMKIE